MTDELAQLIDSTTTLQQVEDIYLPYRPKRRTRATMAKEKGLEPLADSLLDPHVNDATMMEVCRPFVDEEKGVGSVEEALAGAQDIIAERVSEDYNVRELTRNFYHTYGELVVKASDSEATSVCH